MRSAVVIPIESIRAFATRHPIRRLSLFGSVLRDDFNSDSDIDFLVEFLPGARIDFFSLAEMEHELTLLIGRKADLRTAEDLSPYFRQDVMGSAWLLYER